jgi:hypothetical protein
MDGAAGQVSISERKCRKITHFATVAFQSGAQATQALDLLGFFLTMGAPKKRHSHFHAQETHPHHG